MLMPRAFSLRRERWLLGRLEWAACALELPPSRQGPVCPHCVLLRAAALTPVLVLCAVQLGYTLYRRVLGYYSGEEDAYDMRKAMPRDVEKLSIVPLGRPIHPHELEHD